MPEFRIHGSNIVDLEVSPEQFRQASHATSPVEEQNQASLAPAINGLPGVNRQENDPVRADANARQEERLEHPASSQAETWVDPAIHRIRHKPSEPRNGLDAEPFRQERVQDTSQDVPDKIISHPPELLPTNTNVSDKLDRNKLGVRRDLLEEGDASTSDAGTILLKQPDVGSRPDKSGKPIGMTARIDSIKVSFRDEIRREVTQPAKELTTKMRATSNKGQGVLPVGKESHRKKRRRNRRRSNRNIVTGSTLDSDVVPDAVDSSGLASELEEDKGVAKQAGGHKVAFGKDRSVWSWKASTGGNAGAKTRLAGSTSRPRRGHRRAGGHDENDGWATEEATDIQGMGEFDFQGNLSKFDKRTIFDQIRAQDNTAKESRLVSLNRLPAKPGTAGGKNLHHTENVLDSKDGGRWNSEADETEDDTSGERIGSGRSSRRTMSRQSTKQLPSRKGSNILGSSSQPISSSSTRVLSPLNRDPQSARTTSSRQGKYSRVGSPMRSMTPSSVGSLRVLSSGRLCPVLRPVQQLDIERIAEVELGLTEDMMTENAGRGIAEISLMALDADGRRPAKEDHRIEPPFAVVLAGNHQGGLRAIAAARHLHNHGARMIVCMLGQEREALLLESVRRQLQIFERSGGRVAQWEELMTELESLNDTPELVIDALLGTHLNFGDLRRDDQTVAYNLIDWVNNGKFDVLAVDIPTGIDASTGEYRISVHELAGLPGTLMWLGDFAGSMSFLEGEPMCMNAKFVAALGAPKAGLLEALSAGLGSHWKMYVVDLGIGNTAWKTYGTKRRHGVEFGSGWVMELKYQGVSD